MALARDFQRAARRAAAEELVLGRAVEHQLALVVTIQTAVKTDGQQAGVGQLALQHVHHAVLALGVEGIGGFLDKYPGRLLQKQPSHPQALLGAQRNTKIIGIFTRLWKRDGKERYLSFLPRMWGLLERDLAHPALASVKQWFDTHIPTEVRSLSPLDIAHG